MAAEPTVTINAAGMTAADLQRETTRLLGEGHTVIGYRDASGVVRVVDWNPILEVGRQ